MANFAVVVARLIIKGKDYGVQSFFLRIRDNLHKNLPGIDAGEVGPKFGFTMKDNGYLAFDHVRIPRENMLSRYATVSREGKFATRGNPRIMYGTMLTMRILFLQEAYFFMATASMIGLRYAIVRTQFKD